MKKIELLFYRTNPSESNAGMKQVLWEITTPEEKKTYDWGFGYWDGLSWGSIEVPEDYKAQVHSWANTVDPELLLEEKSKIIKL